MTHSPTIRAWGDEFDRRREDRVRREYHELRAVDPDAYRRCVESASATLLNERVALAEVDPAALLRLGAAIEQALVSESLAARRRP